MAKWNATAAMSRWSGDMGARATGIAGSVAMHALLILSLLEITGTAAKPPAQHTDWKEPQEDIVRLRGANPEGLVEIQPIADGLAITGDQCEERSYVGIGILINSFGRLLMVGDNTPASRAGLQTGDVIMNPDELGTHFEPGHVIPIRVVRDGVELAIPIAVRRICQD